MTAGSLVCYALYMQCPAVAIFDLDDTLAESFRAPPADTLAGLGKLLNVMPVSIMTGATFQRMHKQFLSTFESHPHAKNLFIFPTSSAQGYTFSQGTWELLYDLSLTEEERSHIKKKIAEAVQSLPVLHGIPHYGEQTVDKGSQVAYTHVGVDASKEVKDSWDADGSKRGALWGMLKQSLPEFEVLMGGITTIDITRKGINKSYGVTWLSKHLSIPVDEMLYVGDALYPGGNDAVVIPTGIKTLSVSDPSETQTIIDELLIACTA